MAGSPAAVLNLGMGDTPAVPPPSGFMFVYVKSSDGLVYKMDEFGTETLVGGGGGGTFNPASFPEIGPPAFPPGGTFYLYASNVDSKLYGKNDSFETFGPMGGFLGDDLVVYVNDSGSPSGTGTLRDPVLTVQQALNIGFDGMIIVLGQGTFSEATLNFGALTDVTFIGQGIGATVLDSSSVTPFINVTSSMATLRFFNMRIHSKNSSAIVLDGTGLGGGFITELVLINRGIQSDSGSALVMQYVGGVDISNVYAIGSGVICFETCSFASAVRHSVLLGSATRVSWDDASGDKPGAGRFPAVFVDVTTGTNSGLSAPLHLRNQPWTIWDQSCTVGTIDTDFGLSVSGGLAPNVEFHGVADYVYLPAGASGIPDTAIAQTWDFSGARFRSSFGSQAINVGLQGAATNPQTVNADHTRVPSGMGYTAGTNITLTAAGNQPDCQFGGLGIFAPGQWHYEFMGPPAGNGVALAWTGGLTTVSAPKQVIVTPRSDIAAAPPGFDNMGVGAFTTTGFTLWYTGVAGVNDYIDVHAIF